MKTYTSASVRGGAYPNDPSFFARSLIKALDTQGTTLGFRTHRGCRHRP